MNWIFQFTLTLLVDGSTATAALAAAIKAQAVPLVAPRPLAEAISTAGGVDFAALDEGLMLRDLPGVFCAGEMLDWEAPTGGYLLTACLATGRAAGEGVADWLEREPGNGLGRYHREDSQPPASRAPPARK